MHTNNHSTANCRLPPKPPIKPELDMNRIAKWAVASFGGLVLATLLLLLLRALIHNYALDQGAAQVNTMNLPPWALTPVSWAVGAGIVLALPALFRLFTTGTVNRADRRWLIAFVVGALTVNFVSAYNTPKRAGCSEVDACFGSQGQALRWYSVEGDERVVLWDKGGRHPTRNVPLLPINPEVVARWEAQTPLSTLQRNGAPAAAAATAVTAALKGGR